MAVSVEVTKAEDRDFPLMVDFRGPQEMLTSVGAKLRSLGKPVDTVSDRIVTIHLRTAEDLRRVLGGLEDGEVDFACSIDEIIHQARMLLSEAAVATGYDAGGMRVEYPGTEHGPYSSKGYEEFIALQKEIGTRMNRILSAFDVNCDDRYFGEFPYPDRETGAPRLTEIIALKNKRKRDVIARRLRAILQPSCIKDVTLKTDDDENALFKYDFAITAMGESIVSNLLAYRALAQALRNIEKELEIPPGVE